MIVTKEVKIKVLNRLVEFYSKKGYEAATNKEILVKVEDLSHGANVEILCLCESCNREFTKKFRLVKVEEDGSTFCSSCKLSTSAKKRIQKYGSNFQNPVIQRKISTKYASDIEKTREIREKKKKTNLSNHGDPNWNNQVKRLDTIKEKGPDWNNSSKRKQTCFKLYGNENWNNQEKKKRTCIKKYGVAHTQQLDRIFHKTCKFQVYRDSLLYQGSYEKDFLDNFIDVVVIERGKTFFYIDGDGKRRKYFSDFFLPDYNLIVEIKSLYTLKNDINCNLKRESVLKSGYKFLWIIDKNYDSMLKILNRT